MKYRDFIKRYPRLGEAWDTIHAQEAEGPIDARTQRLLKLAVAMGAFREGAVHSAVRKALKAGVTREELEQVVALGASTLGMPSSVAVYTWVQDVLDKVRA
jgi:alkylhydroperoxidase/carboxymuconolactone decarboxylase family protein YurZ